MPRLAQLNCFTVSKCIYVEVCGGCSQIYMVHLYEPAFTVYLSATQFEPLILWIMELSRSQVILEFDHTECVPVRTLS